jgi:hypothetical protein
MNARRIYYKRTDRTTGIICDQTVLLKCFYAMRHDPENLRRIRFKDPETGKTQIWCAVSTYVLIAIFKKELQIDALIYTLLQILSVSVFEKTELYSASQGGEFNIKMTDSSNQLNLLEN